MRNISQTEETKVIHIDDVPLDLHTRVKSEAAKRTQTLRDFVIAALEHSLANKPQESKAGELIDPWCVRK